MSVFYRAYGLLRAIGSREYLSFLFGFFFFYFLFPFHISQWLVGVWLIRAVLSIPLPSAPWGTGAALHGCEFRANSTGLSCVHLKQ